VGAPARRFGLPLAELGDARLPGPVRAAGLGRAVRSEAAVKDVQSAPTRIRPGEAGKSRLPRVEANRVDPHQTDLADLSERTFHDYLPRDRVMYGYVLRLTTTIRRGWPHVCALAHIGFSRIHGAVPRRSNARSPCCRSADPVGLRPREGQK
jgi:hypothetical protein